MQQTARPLPIGRPPTFRATVHGTVFGDRAQHLDSVREGDALLLLPEPFEDVPAAVWVHLPNGEPLGHLPPEIGIWLAPWLRDGGAARVHALRVHGREVPSWRRMLVEVACLQSPFPGGERSLRR